MLFEGLSVSRAELEKMGIEVWCTRVLESSVGIVFKKDHWLYETALYFFCVLKMLLQYKCQLMRSGSVLFAKGEQTTSYQDFISPLTTRS